MSNANDGGPAFPRVSAQLQVTNKDFDIERMNSDGMTLRDWYIGQFASSWVIALSERARMGGYTDEGAGDEAVRLAMKMTDNLLAERERK